MGEVFRNPLVCLTQARDIQSVLFNFYQIPADRLIVKYHHTTRAYKIMREYFLDNKEYTHLVVQPDDLIVTKADFEKLLEISPYYPVISGICNCTVSDPRIAMDITQMPNPNRKLRRYIYTDPIRAIGIVKVYWAGFPFTWIRRDIVERIPFEDDTRLNPGVPPNQGWATDVMFHYNCLQENIPVYANCEVFMKHLKGHPLTEDFQIKTGLERPQVVQLLSSTGQEQDITKYCHNKYLTEEDKVPYYFKDPQTGRKQNVTIDLRSKPPRYSTGNTGT